MPGILSRYAPVQAAEGLSLDNDAVVTSCRGIAARVAALHAVSG